MRTPPKLATVVLERLTPSDPGIVGDLAEEYQSGRSALWYWRQVVGAVVFGTIRELRDHKLVTLRALALGTTSLWFIGNFVTPPLLGFDEWLFTRGIVKWFYLNGYGFPQWFGPPQAMVVISAISGWLVGRTHRRYGVSVVLAFAGFTACGHLLNVVTFLQTGGPDPFYAMTRLLMDLFFIYPLAALLGGLRGMSNGEMRHSQVES